MTNIKKLFVISSFLMAPFYEACVTRVIITDSQYNPTMEEVRVSNSTTNTVIRYESASPTVVRSHQVKRPPKRKKKAIPTRAGPQKRPKKRPKKTKLKKSKKYIDMQNKRRCKKKRKKCRRKVKK